MIDYHKNNVNEQGEFVISHSHLCKLDPLLGGHPKSFYKALTDPNIGKDNPTFDNGNMLHHWLEHKDNFVISDINKPSEKLGQLADGINNLALEDNWKNDPMFLEVGKHDSQIQIEDYDTYKSIYQKIYTKAATQEELAIFVACIRFARKQINYNSNLVESTYLKKVQEIVPYLEHLREADGKVILTSREKDTLNNAQESLANHPFAAKLIFEQKGINEQEFFWKVPYSANDSTLSVNEIPKFLHRKAKVDKHRIDEFNKTLDITDLKTSNFPVSTFPTGAYTKYALGRQLANYQNAFFENHKEYISAEWKINLFNVVIQLNDEFPVMVFRTSNPSTFLFRKELADLEQRAAYHIERNMWNITMEESNNIKGAFVQI